MNNSDLAQNMDRMKSVNERKASTSDASIETTCGFLSFKPKWMQKWATSRVFFCLLSIAAIIQTSYYTYRIGVLTTLEKRFAFGSKISSSILMVEEITSLFFGLPVGYFGGKTHRPHMIAIGMLCSVSCCLISAFPYFIHGPALHLSLSFSNKTNVEMCPADSVNSSCDEEGRPPTVSAVLLLVLAGFLRSFGNLAFNSIGLSYLDDNTRKKNTPIYLAVIQALRLFGPVLGFLLASAFLKYNENPLVHPGYGPEDPRWIGAWWIGFVFLGVLLFLFTIPIAFFPRRLPGTQKNISTTNVVVKNETNSRRFELKSLGIYGAVKRLATNSLFVLLVMNITLSLYGSFGHAMMLPKYMELQFRLTASDASLYSGPPGLTCMILSTVAGGFFLWKCQPKKKTLIAAMATMEFIGALGFLFLMIPRCEKINMSSLGMNENELSTNFGCNSNCSCTTRTFTPICDSNSKKTFFSPCFAGCSDKVSRDSHGKTIFRNCSCITKSLDSESNFIMEGFCKEDTCWSQAIAYIIGIPIHYTIMNTFKVAYVIVFLRAIEPSDKSTALGALEVLTCLFGIIPLLLTFGSITDTSCLIWEESCGQRGNCWFYDVEKFNYLLHGVSGFFQLLSAFSLIALFFQHKKLRDLYDDDVTGVKCQTTDETIELASGTVMTQLKEIN